MEKTAYQGPGVSSSLLYSSRLSFAILVSSAVLICYLSFRFYQFLTIPILVLWTAFFFTLLKSKYKLHVSLVQTEYPSTAHKNFLEREDEEKLRKENETLSQIKGTDQTHDYTTGFSSSSGSENDSVLGDLELKWTLHNTGSEVSLMASDEEEEEEGDEEEEDNLIEISFPRRPSLSKEEQSPGPETNMLELWTEPSFQNLGLLERVAEADELNEEENLIEVDISMDSLKS